MALLQKSFNWIGIGILLGVGFVLPPLWFVGLFGIAYQLHVLNKDISLKNKIFGSWLAWTIKFFFVLSFYWQMYPLSWLPFDFGTAQLGLIFLYWFTVSLFLGTGGIVLALLISLLPKYNQKSLLSYILVVPILWILAEVAGSFFLSVFTFGPGGSLNAYFSLGYVGYLIGNHMILVEVAKIAGVYGLSVLTVLISIPIWRLSKRRSSYFKWTVTAAVVFLIATSNAVVPEKKQLHQNEQVTVALIETSYPVQKLFERDTQDELSAVYEAALQAAIAQEADYIIFPEDSRFFDQHGDIELLKNTFTFTHAETDAIIIDSGRINYGQSSVLQAMILDTKLNEHYVTQKQYLVPQGEFMPYVYTHLFKAFGFSELVDSVRSLVSYISGPLNDQSVLPARIPGVLFCFESTSPIGVRSLMRGREKVPFIAHQAAYSWFPWPTILLPQLDTSLRVQAIWNDTYIASASSFAAGKLYAPTGNIIDPTYVDQGEYWKVGLVTIPIE